MENREPKKDNHSKMNPQARKRLEKFLSAICEAKGMGKAAPKAAGAPAKRIACKCACADAEWRAQLDIPDGVLCVFAKTARRDADGPHRDVTLAVTYLNDEGKEDYADLTFCDSEVRWLMEALWHAPIWD